MKWIEKSLDILTMLLFVAVLSSLLDFSLVFKETMVAGGDMISHPAIVEALKEQWSRGQFWAWNPGWFGGYPNLYYYFYPVYILAATFWAIGFSDVVAFKMSVATVVLSVPCVTFYFGRKWLNYPLALLLTSGMLALFLNEMDSRSGGNLKSLLAGQVSHEVGLIWLVVLFGYLARKKMNSFGAAFALTMVVLSHVYTGLFGGLLVGLVIFSDIITNRSLKVISQYKSVAWAIAMSAFFWIPFGFYRGFTVAPINHSDVPLEQVISLLQLRHPLYLFMYLSGSIGFFYLLITKRLSILYVCTFGLILLSIFSMPHLGGTPILHIRIPAQVYLLALLLWFIFFTSLGSANPCSGLSWPQLL
jgi:uncharacterized membrane protein